MRLDRLDLLAFGHFTDIRLRFNPGLQIVYGPNEAGKTTALRAIRQLLFGFDEKTPDNFIHQYSNLRIGAAILDRSGNQIEVIRRKTRKDSLRMADESANVDSNYWQQLLCGIDEATFSKRYGIDYEQLTEGGSQISKGTGDLGEILFATGSGISDLTTVRKNLNDEAGKFFKPTGKNQKLNVAIAEWQKNRALAKEKLLLATEWEQVDRTRRETTTRLDHVKKCLAERTREASLHRRYQRALPLLGERDSLMRELELLANIKQLPPDFSNRKYKALTLLKHAAELQSSAEETLNKLLPNLETDDVAHELVERTDELTRLFEDGGSYRKAQADRPNLTRQLERLVSECDELLKKLGIAIESRHPLPAAFDRTKRAKLGPLGRKQLALLSAIERDEDQCAAIGEQSAQVERNLLELPVVELKSELRDWIRRARSQGDLESQLVKAQRELQSLNQELHKQVDQLSFKPVTLERLEAIQVPNLETLRQWEDRFAENQRERRIMQTRVAELESQIRQTQIESENLKREYSLATPEDLAQSRQIRDTAWQEIRKVIDSGSAPSAKLLATFEQWMIDVDRIADRLHDEASRVAQFEELVSLQKSFESRRQDAANRLADLEAKRAELEQQWKSEWPDLESAPLPPRDMQIWLAKREDILQVRERLSRVESDHRELSKRIDVLTTGISQALAQPPAQTNPSSLNELLELAEQRMEKSETVRLARRDAEETRSRLKREFAESMERLDRTRKELTQSKTEWQSTLVELGIPSELLPDQVDAYLELLNEFAERHGQAEGLRQRLAGIDSDAAVFEASVRKTCGEVAPDLANHATNEILSTLRERLLTSQKAQTALNELAARKRQADEQIAKAKASNTQAHDLLTLLCSDAGIEQPPIESFTDPRKQETLFEDLTEAEEKSNKKDLLQNKLHGVAQSLQELAEEISPEQFLEQSARMTPADVALRIQQADEECRRLSEERDKVLTEMGEFNQQLKQMDGSSEAAELEEAQRQLAAQIRSDVEQFVRIKLASSILRTAVERYREKIRGPILSVASDLFRELTLNSFDGLRIDEDDHGTPILVGIRSGGGDAIAVDGMSEGTCDQLYLALRLASLSLESEPRNALPFIIDDILIQFDDARSAAALKILSRLGQRRQIIFFTHHEHLLDLAEKHLSGHFNVLKLAP